MIDQFRTYTNFTIKSQVLLYSDFDSYKINTEKEMNLNERGFYLKPSDLSIMTNFIENRLGSRISDSSALEFVTYVPSKQPMFILDNENQKLNSFLVPRWGGIFVYNQEDKNVNTIENDHAMKIFLTQFLQLIGVNLNKVNLKRYYVYIPEDLVKVLRTERDFPRPTVFLSFLTRERDSTVTVIF